MIVFMLWSLKNRMKIYYNFNKNQRNFSLSPSGDCISTETEEPFRDGYDDEKTRQYIDCHSIDIKERTNFKLHVIIYDDNEKDYLGDDKKMIEYYNWVKDKYKHIKPIVKEGKYYKYGFIITETSYQYDYNYFIETEWIKESTTDNK